MWIAIIIAIIYIIMGIISLKRAIKLDGKMGDTQTAIVMIIAWPWYFKHLF